MVIVYIILLLLLLPASETCCYYYYYYCANYPIDLLLCVMMWVLFVGIGNGPIHAERPSHCISLLQLPIVIYWTLLLTGHDCVCHACNCMPHSSGWMVEDGPHYPPHPTHCCCYLCLYLPPFCVQPYPAHWCPLPTFGQPLCPTHLPDWTVYWQYSSSRPPS